MSVHYNVCLHHLFITVSVELQRQLITVSITMSTPLAKSLAMQYLSTANASLWHLPVPCLITHIYFQPNSKPNAFYARKTITADYLSARTNAASAVCLYMGQSYPVSIWHVLQRRLHLRLEVRKAGGKISGYLELQGQKHQLPHQLRHELRHQPLLQLHLQIISTISKFSISSPTPNPAHTPTSQSSLNLGRLAPKLSDTRTKDVLQQPQRQTETSTASSCSRTAAQD